jgi:Spy/CpxP family protein refolding chaperone
MKSRKKYFIIGAIILLFALFIGLGLIIACGPPGFCDRDPHPVFPGKGFHPRFFGKDFSGHILSRMDSRVKELDLSETQMEEYEEIRLKVKAGLTKAMENRREFFRELKREINKDNPDMNALSDYIRQHLNKMPDFMSYNLDLFMEFYNVLDENQRTRLLEKFRNRMDRFGAVMCSDQ